MIALAQELYLHYADKELAVKAREAAVCQLEDVSYGSSRACAGISKYVAERLKRLASDRDLARYIL